MKIIMAGGGTGGHIYPAIAIADKIKAKNPKAEILFVGTEHGMEKELVAAAGYDIRFITVSGFDRKHLTKNVKTLRDLMTGMKESAEIIDEFEPDVVIGTGGYVCGPIVRQASRKGIKTYIHEQNALPGMTNRLLSRHVDKIFVSFEDAVQHFKVSKKKIVVTGNPIREAFFTGNRTRSRLKIGLSDEFVVLCFGGSLGAEKINETMLEVMSKMKDVPNLKIFFVTGKRHYKATLDKAKKIGISENEKFNIAPYLDNIYDYLKGCDLVICRSGALTVSEITACGRASILIPSPNVTGNHQYYNAKVLADRGGSILIEENDLTSDAVRDEITRLMEDKAALIYMGSASRTLAERNSALLICKNIWPDDEKYASV